MSLLPGARVGPYEIVALVGAGGMGEVYRARDTKLHRDVALKIIRDAGVGGVDRASRFEREAHVLASLNHQHIAAIYGFEDAGDVPALVLEFVEGPTLADRIAQGPIPLAEALPIARQIAEALTAAHDQGIVHRDLKPSNVKLRGDGTVKVLDFGLAKVFTDESRGPEPYNSPTLSLGATRAGIILGTAAYMSPEQARGRPVDKRTDVWAFGCVLYEMLTGRRAFGGEDVSDTLAFVITKDIDWTALPPATPPPIRRLLRRCLDKDRNLRLRDIGDASLELADALTMPDGEAAAPLTSSRQFRARAVSLLLVGLLAGAAVTGGLLTMWQRPVAPDKAPVRRFGITLPATAQLLGGGVSRNIALSADGTRLAFIGTNGQLFLRSLGQLDVAPTPGLGPVRDPFFSPDGHWVAFFTSGTGDLRKMPVTGGPALSVASDSGVSRGASWGADGTIVFATSATGTGLLRVPSGGGTPEVLTTPDPKQGEIDHVFPEILPNGRTVLFTILSLGSVDNSQIAVIDLKTRERKVLLRGGRHAQYASSGHVVFGVGNTLRAVVFDAERLEVLSEPQPVLDQVATVATGAMNVAMARDGTLLYIPGGMMDAVQQRTLVWVDRQGNEEPIDAPERSYQIPRASPDGTRLVAQLDDPASSDIAVYDLQRKALVRLTFGKTSSIRPTWTPDSRWVLFRSDLDGPGIYRKAGDGGGAIERIVGVKGDGGPHNVSPDGRTLVFSQVDPTTGRDLWMLDLAGDRTARPLAVEPGPQSNGVISPDGRWLAYHAEDVGAIFVRPFPDPAGGRWEVVPAGSKWPLWSRDGRELFYVSAQGMMAIDVETSQQTFRWKSPRVLFPASYFGFVGLAGARNYDLSPDGKRFLLIKDKVREQSAAALVVVQNWFEELKVLAPAKQ